MISIVIHNFIILNRAIFSNQIKRGKAGAYPGFTKHDFRRRDGYL